MNKMYPVSYRKMHLAFLHFLLIIILISAADVVSAKKVICVDGAGDAYLNNHEGYERQFMTAGDTMTIGGSLTDCLDLVEDGDELIIITHGIGMGTGFKWGGMDYTGFGNGPNKMPVPLGFDTLEMVTVKFCSCWSANDPDGIDPNKPLTEKLFDAMGGSGNGHPAPSGFIDYATAESYLCIFPTVLADTVLIKAALAGDSWQDQPPGNRPNLPPGTKTQLDSARCILDTVSNFQGTVTISAVKFDPPYNSVTEPGTGGGCVDCEEGCGFAPWYLDILDSDPNVLVPTLGEWGLILLTLLLLTLASVAIVHRSGIAHLALSQGNIPLQLNKKFDAKLYKRRFIRSLLFAPIVLFGFYLGFGEILIADLLGTICSLAIVSYLIHFIRLNQQDPHTE